MSLLNSNPIPTVDPLAANSHKEECAEDLVGVPTIALPPPPAVNPAITATAAQASTEILCATDDPDPANSPGNNEDCDAGRRSFEQQIISKADAGDIHIVLGGNPANPADPSNPSIELVVQAANTSARAFCGPGNVPTLTSHSNVVNLVLKVGGLVVPVQLPPADQEAVLDLGVLKLTLNERVGTEGAKADNSPADELTRRAIHLEVPGGTEPNKGSIADLIVAESVADFHGDVCPEGKIVVKKETAPDENPNTTSFGFTAGPNLVPGSASFNLMDDGSKQLQGTAPTLTASDNEVLPGIYSVTENPPTNDYILTAINCAENRSDNSTVDATTLRRATIDVGPGETVTCTFINAKPPPGICPAGSIPNAQGQCIITQVNCPAGSTLNQQGQCIINAVTCPTGSIRPDPNGPCVVTNITCPAGSTGPNQQGQCINNTTTCPPGSASQSGQCVNNTITCPAGTEGPNGQGQCVNNTLNCPSGSTQVGNTCVVSRPDCPAGTGRNPQGQCVITSVQCPSGTVFNPPTLGCAEGPSGGIQVPINQIAGFFRGSPCIGQGFGPLVGILGTEGPDRITGTNNSDRIFALGGNDRVSGGRGDDCVEGGSGNDVIDGSNGNDTMLGASGGDRIEGGPGNDRMEGGSSRDNVSGGQGNDRMNGGSGNDRMNGGFGNDVIRGGPGRDGISNGNGKDRVYGGTGNDTINVAIVAPAAFVDCGPGRDRVRISPGKIGSAKRDRTRNCEFLYIAKRTRAPR
ncbi:MAG: hypothetical protein ABR549_02735 [Mycobacteriales bacterium]